jgi:hypothetical protein
VFEVVRNREGKAEAEGKKIGLGLAGDVTTAVVVPREQELREDFVQARRRRSNSIDRVLGDLPRRPDIED